MNAINDALGSLHATPLTEMPFTPGRILKALDRI
jgi:carbon-monoxide dehydrogenase large subunit